MRKNQTNHDPRKVGGEYHNGYWGKRYKVLSIQKDGAGLLQSITVKWEDGEQTTHATAWDAHKDRVLSQPELQKIIDTQTPSVVNPSLRKERRKVWAVEIRRLLKGLGITGVSVRTPNYSMASSVEITLPPAAEHSNDSHDYASCPLCQQRNQAREAIERVILGAFPDLNDRSEYVSDSFDYCLSVS